MVGDRLRAHGRASTPARPWSSSTPPRLGLERALSGASLRQAAIAENIANVNTPGYRRKDVDFHDRAAAAPGTRPRRRGRARRADRSSRPDAHDARRRQLGRHRHRGRRPGQERPELRGDRAGHEGAHRHPPVRDRASADGPLRRHRRRRLRPQRRAPADGRHRREPRQRADDQGRRRPAVPPQGGRPAEAGADGPLLRLDRSRGQKSGDTRGVKVAGIVEDQSALKRASTTRATRTPTRTATSTMPNVNTGHRDGRPHLRLRAPTRPTSRRCRPPRRCSPARWTSCADADRPPSDQGIGGGAEWNVGAVGELDGAAGDRRGRRRGRRRASAQMLADQLGSAREASRTRPPTRRASLADGTATDPSAAIVAVERAQLAMQLAVAAAHEGRRGHQRRHAHPGLGHTLRLGAPPSMASSTP